MATVREIASSVKFHSNCKRRNVEERSGPGYPGKQIKNLNLYGFTTANFGNSCRLSTNLDMVNDLNCTDLPESPQEMTPTDPIQYPPASGMRFCGQFMKDRHHDSLSSSPFVSVMNKNPLADWP